MHDSKLGAPTWLLALFLIVSNPKSRSSVQLAADLGITQKSAWHVGHRIREALANGSLPGFDGPVQVDETYIGTYHYWSDDHLYRYVDEHSFRYNQRSRHVLNRMADAAAAMNGRRLPWRELVTA